MLTKRKKQPAQVIPTQTDTEIVDFLDNRLAELSGRYWGFDNSGRAQRHFAAESIAKALYHAGATLINNSTAYSAAYNENDSDIKMLTNGVLGKKGEVASPDTVSINVHGTLIEQYKKIPEHTAWNGSNPAKNPLQAAFVIKVALDNMPLQLVYNLCIELRDNSPATMTTSTLNFANGSQFLNDIAIGQLIVQYIKMNPYKFKGFKTDDLREDRMINSSYFIIGKVATLTNVRDKNMEEKGVNMLEDPLKQMLSWNVNSPLKVEYQTTPAIEYPKVSIEGSRETPSRVEEIFDITSDSSSLASSSTDSSSEEEKTEEDKSDKTDKIKNGSSEKIQSAEKDPAISLLDKFKDEKLARVNDPNFKITKKEKVKYIASINDFHEKGITIIKTSANIDSKVKQLKELAHNQFHHRHWGRRLLADALMVISSIVGVGIAVGAYRKTHGKTYFFSNAKTEREESFSEVAEKIRLKK